MKLYVVFDDTGKKSEVIEDIIGNKGFADVVVKKRHLEDYYRDSLKKMFPDLIWKKIHFTFEYSDLIKELESEYEERDVKVMHCFSNYLITDLKKAEMSLKKN